MAFTISDFISSNVQAVGTIMCVTSVLLLVKLLNLLNQSEKITLEGNLNFI